MMSAQHKVQTPVLAPSPAENPRRKDFFGYYTISVSKYNLLA